jgi:hypothetical protein
VDELYRILGRWMPLGFNGNSPPVLHNVWRTFLRMGKIDVRSGSKHRIRIWSGGWDVESRVHFDSLTKFTSQYCNASSFSFLLDHGMFSVFD